MAAAKSRLLHFEMAAAKSFMNLCWEPFMREICKELGFTTENTQAYSKKGSDHHKLWDIIEICYIAFADEIIVEFLRYCNLTNIEPNVESFWNYSAVLKNPNFVFMQQMAFVYLHALILFRRGIRTNNVEYIYAGKNKLSILLFGRNHPNYHQLISLERKIEIQMPPEISSVKFASLVLSRTNRIGFYQSGDVVIEEINKIVS